MRVGIGLKQLSYTPEAYAYSSYLKHKGVSVDLAPENDLDINNDINIYFMGIRPFWQKSKSSAVEVHEYQSLSTGGCPTFKDFLKKTLNRQPSGRIYLNSVVSERLGFSADIPHIYRDMGVDRELFQRPDNSPEYDLVYCGSIDGRPGLVEELSRLAKIGYKILVIGAVTTTILEVLKKNNNITMVGKVGRFELSSLYKKAKAGLNYTPNIYPFNLQTSTKTLEYLAAGLAVVSNKYEWSENFSTRLGVEFYWLNEVDSVIDFKYAECNMQEFSWEHVLDRSGLYSFLSELKC